MGNYIANNYIESNIDSQNNINTENENNININTKNNIINIIMPYDILDEIFKKCDNKTKGIFRIISKDFLKRYQKITKDPFDPIIRMTEYAFLIYYGKSIKKIRISGTGYKYILGRVEDCYKYLVRTYNLDITKPITFNIKFNDKNKKYIVTNINNNIRITTNKKIWCNSEWKKIDESPYYRSYTIVEKNKKGINVTHGRYKGNTSNQADKLKLTYSYALLGKKPKN